jgi:hypothetical protein
MSDQKPSAGKQALETAVTAVPYVGQIYKGAKIAKKFALPVVMMLVLLLIGPCAGPQNANEQPITPAEQLETVAVDDVISQSKKAARVTGRLEETGVPWTLIAALALKATIGGRFSPFDQCDRLPDGAEELSRPGYSLEACSEEPTFENAVVVPAIGGEADPALGPFLLKRGVIPQDDGEFEIDPQSFKATIRSLESTPRTAIDFVTLRLAELRVELTNDGFSFDPADADSTARAWAEAVRRLGVMDPHSASGCLTPFFPPHSDPAAARKDASKVVEITWRCYLSLVPLRTFGTSSLTSDPAELTNANAVSTALREALTVSWAFSQWGTVMRGCAIDTNGIVTVTAADAVPAGFFPLTKAVFDEFNTTPEAHRCDKAANVAAAARAFAAGETIEPGKRRDSSPIGDRTDDAGTWNKAIGGWAAMPWALGADLDTLPEVGPLSIESTKFTPTKECSTDAAAWVESASANLATTYRPEFPELPAADGSLIAAHVAVNPLPASCVVKANAMQVFNQFIAGISSNSGNTLWSAATPPTLPPASAPEATQETLPPASAIPPPPFTADQQRASALLALAQWFYARQGSTVAPAPSPPLPGFNSIIPRLSLTGAQLPACEAAIASTCLPEFPQQSPDGYSQAVVQVARAAGGIVEADPNAKGDLFSLLGMPKFGALSGSACLPPAVGKAIDNALAKYQQVMLQSTEAEALRIRRAKSVIPVDLILEQYATESSFAVGYVDDLGGTGVVMAPEGGVADVGPERGPNKSPSMTRGIIGPRIGEAGYADTDGGRIDGLINEDRAVGVLQFIPQSWNSYLRLFPGLLLDGNGDSVVDPHNAYDQTLAMVLYYARNAEGRDLGVDLVAREQSIAQYGGFTVGSPGFASYMQRRIAKTAPMLACLQAEGAVSGSAGVVLGPDGCPTSVPENTMLQGAIELNIHDMCVTAVSAAPTPEAKKAILFLMANLGTPYSVTNRGKQGFFDCSSYVMRAYNSAGLRLGTPSSYALGPAPGWSSFPWLRDVSAANIKPGDILVRVPPAGHHVMVYLSDEWMIHTGGPEGTPAHITKLPDDFSSLKKRRVVSELAPRS